MQKFLSFPQLLQNSTLNSYKTHIYVPPQLPCAIVSDTEKSKSYPKHSLSCNSKGLNIIFFQYVTCQRCIVRNSKLCRCNIWQFIYKKNCKEVMAKSAKRGQKWQYRVKSGENWEKRHLSSCGISSPLGFTHRRSRTSSKFGT